MAVYKLEWHWGAKTELPFNVATDILDCGWFEGSQITIIGRVDSVVVVIPSNEQSYTLKGATLATMTMNNIIANADSCKRKWQDVLAGADPEPAPGPSPSPEPGPAPGPSPDPVPPVPPQPPVEGKYYSPYIDMGLWKSRQLADICKAAGVKSVTMGFLVGSGDKLIWGGASASLSEFLPIIKATHAEGVDVIPSFGGATGPDPAGTFTSASALASQMQLVIQTYGVTQLDFDIEGWANINSHNVVALRNEAIVLFQQTYPDVRISFTLPVMPSGLTTECMAMMQTVKAAGVRIDRLNIMAMDYGPAMSGMGQAAIDAANSVYAQLKTLGYPDATVGITPMIGMNDAAGETFTLDDAEQVLAFAQATSWVESLGAWSLSRDNGSQPGAVTYDASGIVQTDYAFSKIFDQV